MMQPLTQTEFAALLAEGTVLQAGTQGPRLIEHPNQLITKFFPPRKCLSSNLLVPYAKRFVKNAHRLQALQVQTVNPLNYGRLERSRTYYVTYPKIAGQDIRDYLSATKDSSILEWIAGFLAKLHEYGIFFRGIHLGNILQRQPEGDFALIDISVVKFKNKQLSLSCRKRNLRHLVHYPEDKAEFSGFGLTQFIHCYLKASSLSLVERKRLERAFAC
jgi:serine/threonine protein kinase